MIEKKKCKVDTNLKRNIIFGFSKDVIYKILYFEIFLLYIITFIR